MAPRTPKDLAGDTERAIQILELFTDPSKGRDVRMLIPQSVLANAHGIVFIRLIRIGLMLSAKTGTGIIVGRLPDGTWSAPSGISMNSLGFGHLAGAEVIDSIIVMNYRGALEAFLESGGQIQLGVGVSLAAGPYGRAADIAASASSSHIAATYSYSSSKGLFVGYSMEGSKISERVNTNAAFYGRPIGAREILTGGVRPPMIAERLYMILRSIGAGPNPGMSYVNNVNNGAYVPPPAAAASTSSSQPFPQDKRPSQLPTTPGLLAHPNTQTTVLFDSSEPPPPYEASGEPRGEPAVTDAKRPYINNDWHTPVKPPAPPPQPSSTVVIAKYDYTGQSPADLSFSAGDTIIVTKRTGDRESWWEGEIGTRTGSFPANYTEDLAD
ncbi:hypothetical protein DFQ28_009409 [Apophysomyces sp. BC1034]|nr:hypothetical protein DFQ29_007752 [Apophysomyces sp. BC1021]KAG0185392.1 hypothetical protein DFQ28_009409 [Apophysomyces sp. BC1034]